MEYFKKDSPAHKELEDTLNMIEPIIRNFYETRSGDSKYRLMESTLKDDELIAFIRTYLGSAFTMGELTGKYETLCAQYFQTDYSVSCNSGSSANLLAISSLVETGKLKVGDRVIVPALAWSTTIFPLHQYGLIPVFIDQENFGYNIDLEKVEEYLINNKADAIMLIHTYGNPCNMDKIMELSENYKLIIIEDSCESMGATWGGKKIGSFGEVGTFSTYFSHHMSTIEGGIVTTNNKDIDSMLRSNKSHGWARHLNQTSEVFEKYKDFDRGFLFPNTGYNLRITEPQAAIGIEQIKKIDTYVEKRRKYARRLIENLKCSKIKKYLKFQEVDEKGNSSYFGIPIILNERIAKFRDQIMTEIKNSGIECRPFLCGDFTRQPVMNKIKHEVYKELKTSAYLHKSAFAIPCHQELNEEDADIISTRLIKVFNQMEER